MNKWISIMVSTALLLSTLVAPAASASGDTLATTTKTNNNNIQIQAKSAILVDALTGQVVFEFNADEVRPPASMTKMMTEYIVLEEIRAGRLQWDTLVTVSNEAASTPKDGSQVFLAEGDQHTVKELYIAMAVGSANDATIALATHISGTESAFVEKMNGVAKQLGLMTAKFTSATGLLDTTVISARDLAKFALILLKGHPEFLEYSSLSTYKFRARDTAPIINWNWMLEAHAKNPLTPMLKGFTYTGVDGLKTGYISAAGYCFAGTVKRGNQRYISVVMGTNSKDARFKQTAKLYNYAFDSFEAKVLVETNSNVQGASYARISKGVQRKVKAITAQEIKLLVRKGIEPVINQTAVEFLPQSQLVAPIDKGQIVGSVTYSYTDPTSGATTSVKTDLLAATKVEKGSWFRLFMRSIGDFFVDLYDKILNLF